MVEISLNFPINTSFLSEILYEGILYLIYNAYVEEATLTHLKLKEIKKTIKSLDNDVLNRMKILLARNDYASKRGKRRKPIDKLLEALSLKDVEIQRNYGSLISVLKENVNKISLKEHINVSINIGHDMLIDVESKNDGIALPQLFKVDRYTGISSLDTRFISKHITTYASKEVIIILLLGLYSSFVTVTYQQLSRERRREIYFFLTFSPEEIIKLLLSCRNKPHVLLKDYYIIKDLTKNAIRKIVSKTTLNEALLIELALNLEIREALHKYNLDKTSFVLFKIVPEIKRQGVDTYKVYEQTLITIYRVPPFIHTLRKFFKNTEDILRKISWILNPDGKVMDALSKPDSDEHSDVVEAIIGLYRFVVLGDPAGWYLFTRKLMDAHNVALRRKTYNNEYVKLLSNLTF